jgi:uncharacterized protein YbjT (DUF2867 family)
MTPSDKEEAERRYPDHPREWNPHIITSYASERAAFIAGMEHERAARAAQRGPIKTQDIPVYIRAITVIDSIATDDLRAELEYRLGSDAMLGEQS